MSSSGSHRWQLKRLFAVMVATTALGGGAQVLNPASAAAMDGNEGADNQKCDELIWYLTGQCVDLRDGNGSGDGGGSTADSLAQVKAQQDARTAQPPRQLDARFQEVLRGLQKKWELDLLDTVDRWLIRDRTLAEALRVVDRRLCRSIRGNYKDAKRHRRPVDDIVDLWEIKDCEHILPIPNIDTDFTRPFDRSPM